MTVGLLLTLLTAAEPIRLAAPELQGVGIDAPKAQFFSDYFAQGLAANGLKVTTRAEILAVVGVERQKQLLGCSAEDSTSCLTELAGALGVEAIVTGSVAKTEGGSYAVTLKIVSARDASQLSLAGGRLKSEEALLDFLSEQAPRMAAEVAKALRPRGNGAAPATGATASEMADAPIPRGWIAVGAGAVVMVVGGVLYGLARVDESNIRNGTTGIGDEAALASAVRAGRAKEASGIFLLGVGLGAGTSALHWALGPGGRQAAWAPLAVGAALMAVGGALYLVARLGEQSLRNGAASVMTQAELEAAISTGRNEETIGFGILGIGVGALVNSALLWVLGVEAPGRASVSVAAGPHGAGLVFSKGF